MAQTYINYFIKMMNIAPSVYVIEKNVDNFVKTFGLSVIYKNNWKTKMVTKKN